MLVTFDVWSLSTSIPHECGLRRGIGYFAFSYRQSVNPRWIAIHFGSCKLWFKRWFNDIWWNILFAIQGSYWVQVFFASAYTIETVGYHDIKLCIP